MKTMDRLICIACVIVLAIDGGRVQSADTPLALIPTQTGLLVRFKNPHQIFDKVVAIADQLEMAVLSTPASKDPRQRWGQAMIEANPVDYYTAEDGLDPNRDSWAFYSSPYTSTSKAQILPAKNAAAFREVVAKKLAKAAIKENSTEPPDEVFAHEGWVIHGSPGEVAAIKQRIAGELESIETRFDAESRAVFDQGDVGVFVDLKHLSAINGVAAMFGQQMVASWLQGDGFGIQGASAEAAKEALTSATAAVAQAFLDLDHFALSVSIETDQITCDQHLAVREGSDIAKLFELNPGSEMQLLSTLPGENAVYFGSHFNWKAIMLWLSKKLSGIVTDETQKSYWVEAYRAYEQFTVGTFVTALPMRPIEQGILRSLWITEVDDPTAYRQLEAKYEAIVETARPIERSTETYGEHSVEVLQYPSLLGIMVNGAGLGQQFAGLETLLFGPDGSTKRTIVLKDRIVGFYGGSKLRSAAALRRAALLAEGKAPVEQHLSKMRDKLDRQANLIVMFDPSYFVPSIMALFNWYSDMVVQQFAAGVAVPMAIVVNDIPAEEPAEDDNHGSKPELSEDAEAGVQLRNLKLGAKSPSPDEPQEIAPDADDDSEPMDQEAEMDNAGEALQGIEIDQSLVTRFETAEINAMFDTPKLMGFSLSLKPKSCHLRFVIPVDSLQQTVKSASALVPRFIKMSHIMEVDEDMEMDEEEAEPEN